MLTPGILALVLACVILVFGLVMLDKLLVDTADVSVTVTNETLTTLTSQLVEAETVTAAGKCGFHNFAISYAINSSLHTETIDITNFTVGGRAGTVYLDVTSIHNNTDVNITYSYLWGDGSVCQDVNSTLSGVGDFANFIDLIVLAVIIAIIVSLILWAFTFRRER